MPDNIMDKPSRTPNTGYGGEGRRTIEMPPLDQIHNVLKEPIEQNELPQAFVSTPTDNDVAPVPDYVPQDIIQEMQSTVREDSEEPTEEELEEAQAVAPTQPIKKAKENPAAIRIRELKEASRKAEREKEEMAKLIQLQQMQMQQMQLQQMPKQSLEEPTEEYDFHLEDDSLAEGKDLKKVYQEMRAIKNELKTYKSRTIQEQARTQEELAQARLLANYPDIYSVCSKENLSVLEAMQPELAETILSNPNKYNQMVSAYKMVKQFGIDQEPIVESNIQRAIKNTNKPRPANSIRPQQGSSPLEKANAFAQGEVSPQMQEILRKEMYNAIRNH